jgi:hypothetical protein
MERKLSQTLVASTESLSHPPEYRPAHMPPHATKFLGHEYEWDTVWDSSVWDSQLSLGYEYESRHRNSLMNYMTGKETATEKDAMTENGTMTEVEEKEPEYISGFRLAAVVGSLTMVIFVLLLDVSIISTVSFQEEDPDIFPSILWQGD